MQRAAIAREIRVDRACPDRIDFACYCIAFVTTIVWFFAYRHAPQLCDEPGHMAAIYHFVEGRPGWPESMPMLPGYHFIVVSLWKLRPPIELVTLARLVTTLIALLGLAVFALAWRRFHCVSGSPRGEPDRSARAEGAGRVTLLFALLPLMQPFNGMVYTDVPAVAFVLFAWWAHVASRPAMAALFLTAAVAMRQTNLAWAGFVIAWEFLRDDLPRRNFWKRTRWQFLLLGVAAVIVALTGRLTVGTQHGNDFRFNSATIHFAGFLVLLLGFPVWLAHASAFARRGIEKIRTHPAGAAALLVLAGAAAGTFAATFSNLHIWNRDLFWPGCSFTLLRNWPLVWIDAHPWLRIVSGINLVLMGVAVWFAISRQRHRIELWLALGCGALPPLTNSLVEPRYFIPGLVFILFFIEFDSADLRRLAWWWAFLCAVHAPLVATALSLW
ncbi:MAG: hypothetical protein ACREH8_12145 [Opitutaceae bacterium]